MSIFGKRWFIVPIHLSTKRSGILPGGGEKFFPVIGYPPVTMFQDMDEEPLLADFAKRMAGPMSAYVHIPFCPSRCTLSTTSHAANRLKGDGTWMACH